MFSRRSVCLFVLMPQSTIFSHVGKEPPHPGYYQYFSGSKCVFDQVHNTAEVSIEPPTSRSEVINSTTWPSRSPFSRSGKSLKVIEKQ